MFAKPSLVVIAGCFGVLLLAPLAFLISVTRKCACAPLLRSENEYIGSEEDGVGVSVCTIPTAYRRTCKASVADLGRLVGVAYIIWAWTSSEARTRSMRPE